MLTSRAAVGEAARMTIVVGYVPTPEGEAALTAAISEARLREQPLHVVNSSRGDSSCDNRFASEDALDERARPAGRDRRRRTRSTSRSGATRRPRSSSRGRPAEGQPDRHRSPAAHRRPASCITGSQAQRILLDANCPVLAVKASTDGH